LKGDVTTSDNVLANPKSQILKLKSELIKMFAGLRSLCITLA